MALLCEIKYAVSATDAHEKESWMEQKRMTLYIYIMRFNAVLQFGFISLALVRTALCDK